ncbi:MAG: thermopsin family protease [Thermoplasmata archaeon]
MADEGETPASNGSPALAEQGLRASAFAKVPAYDALLPRPSATPAQVAAAATLGHVTPLYDGGEPAPMGIADYGLSSGPGGQVVPSIVNTTEIAGTFETAGPGIQPLYLTAASPDGYSVDLAATSSNVALFGNSSYSFWFEDAAEYFVGAHQLVFVANVWNFSSGEFQKNTFYKLTNTTEVGYSYVTASYAVPFSVSGPFTVSLQINSTDLGGRDGVNFTAGVSTSTNHTELNFAQVVFNSLSKSVPAVQAADLTADGTRYNPVGLTDDFELVLGGPGGGAQTNVYLANATLRLEIWNSSTHSPEPLPSAYSYGGDSADTASGVSVGWQASGDDEATLAEGPSILRGLWNASGAPGLDPVNVSLNVPNAFLFFAPEGANNFTSGGGTYWAPDSRTTDYELPPGMYTLTALMSDFTPTTQIGLSVPLGGSAVVVVDLIANASEGIYTPLWAWGNVHLGGISSTGTGAVDDPYLVLDDQRTDIGSLFGVFNDLTFPVFAGVLLVDTNASVLLARMPSLAVTSPYSSTPAVNDLSYQFYNTSGVGLVDSPRVSGWYTDLLGGEYPRWATDSVVLWNSSDDLIANDTFATQTAGVLLYGGTDNTIWGNTFTMVPTPRFPNGTLYLLNLSVGLDEAESGDLVYNNVFDTTVTAVTPVGNLYDEGYYLPNDTWNINPESASNSTILTLFPSFPLVGSILGTAKQGGNYWWDYGTPANPFGVLPYTAGGDIAVGGDDAPLLPGPPTSVTLAESGLLSGTPWTLEVDNATTDVLLYSGNLTSADVVLLLPENGTYAALGASGSLGASVTFAVTGLTLVTLVFHPTYTATFQESGLPADTVWGVRADYRAITTPGDQIAFPLVNGTWSYSVQPPVGFTTAPVSSSVAITGGNVTVQVPFAPILYAVTFAPSGLVPGTHWSVSVNGILRTNLTSDPIELELANGSYSASYNASGYTISPATAEIEVFGAPLTVSVPFVALHTYLVQFVESGLTVGTNWSVTVDGVATRASSTTTITFLLPYEVHPYLWEAGAVPGFEPLPTNGSFLVVNVSVEIELVFVGLPIYDVTFSEAGLPSGTLWSVNLSGKLETGTSTAIVYQLPAGPYQYRLPTVPGFSAHPNEGKFNVTTTALGFAVQYSPVTPGVYTVTYSETGLPAGTNWSVTLGPAVESATASTVTFIASNGSYSWAIPNVAGYFPTPASGTVTVSGGDEAVSTVFQVVPPGSYGVTFLESGLPLGTNWSVTLDGTEKSSLGTTILFNELNASFPYTVAAVPGYASGDASGTVTVAGAPMTIHVAFSPVSPKNTYLGISYLEWGVVLGAIAVLMVALAILLRRRERAAGASRPPPAPQVPPRASPPNTLRPPQEKR